MSDWEMVVWAVGIAAWAAFVVYVIWISRQVWKDRLMRCPETGVIALVGVEYASPDDGSAPKLVVRRCGLWPSKPGCAHGCLERYEETVLGFPPNLKALRPINRV